MSIFARDVPRQMGDNLTKPTVMSIQQQMEFSPPRWDDDDAYEGAQDWSYRRWAWEFLRRNQGYQAACREASWARGEDRTAVAGQYGRRDLRPYWMEYQRADDERDLWLAEHVEMISNSSWSTDGPSSSLREGQVALIFDLTQTATAGTAAIVAMQARANELLRQALSEYASTQGIEERPQLFRPAAKSLLEKYLRLYDAIEIFGVSRDDTVSVLYPQYWDKKKQSYTEGTRYDAHKAISKNLKKARQLVSGEYKTLVPLDVVRATA